MRRTANEYANKTESMGDEDGAMTGEREALISAVSVVTINLSLFLRTERRVCLITSTTAALYAKCQTAERSPFTAVKIENPLLDA